VLDVCGVLAGVLSPRGEAAFECLASRGKSHVRTFTALLIAGGIMALAYAPEIILHFALGVGGLAVFIALISRNR
jgi:hypothetical protein